MLAVFRDLIRIWFRTRAEIIAENLFLRRQLALYRERKIRRHRPAPADKVALIVLSRFFPWAGALAIVKPSTFIRWHRAGFRLFWRWKSRVPGRRPLPKNVQALILTMAKENPSWGERRIADELSLKLGLLVDPRTVGKYIKRSGRPRSSVGQRWSTRPRNCGVRLLHFGYGNISRPLRVRRHRDRKASNFARKRDRPSERGVDAAAVQGLPRRRIRPPLLNP